jgi:hypothetical protein
LWRERDFRLLPQTPPPLAATAVQLRKNVPLGKKFELVGQAAPLVVD